MDKKEKMGFIIFIICASVIILIGIISSIYNYAIVGPQGGRFAKANMNYSGGQIIFAGIVMLLICGILNYIRSKERN